ncbi:MAG: hypothetical protein PWQ96_1927 [Clostridia bacterium]|jgi:hypothetical protein|nr:hypothetical protein [Clostridiales bacterium]MDK2986283.1 hypothetical protein [Clostridia bacterium]
MAYFLPFVFFIFIANLFGGIKVIFINLIIIALFSWITSFKFISLNEILFIEVSGILLIIILLLVINLKNRLYVKQNISAFHLTLLGLAIAVVTGTMLRPGLGASLGGAAFSLGIGKIYTEKGLWGLIQLYSVTIIQFTGSLFIALQLMYFFLHF